MIYSDYEPEFLKCAASFPIIWKKAKGSYVWDDLGNKYIDFSCGIFVTNVGHSNKHIKKYIKKYMNKNLMFTFSFPTDIRRKYINELMSFVPIGNSVALYSTGSEASDKAIQIARKFTGKKEIVTYKDCYNGNTAELQRLYNEGKYRLDFPKFEDDIHNHLKKLNGDEIAAVIVEAYQGWSCRIFPGDYLNDLYDWCIDNNVLFIMDEIQSGFYRTGTRFMCEYYEVFPHILLLGKAISGGLPLSAIISTDDLMECMNDEKFASTHSGNTLVLASALGNLKAIEEISENDILYKSVLLEEKLRLISEKFDIIDDIKGIGMIWAIHFKSKEIADKVALRCLNHGLMICNTGKNTIKIGPPLTIKKKDLLGGVYRLTKAIEEVQELC